MRGLLTRGWGRGSYNGLAAWLSKRDRGSLRIHLGRVLRQKMLGLLSGALTVISKVVAADYFWKTMKKKAENFGEALRVSIFPDVWVGRPFTFRRGGGGRAFVRWANTC